jgi:hypothetical protein
MSAQCACVKLTYTSALMLRYVDGVQQHGGLDLGRAQSWGRSDPQLRAGITAGIMQHEIHKV